MRTTVKREVQGERDGVSNDELCASIDEQRVTSVGLSTRDGETSVKYAATHKASVRRASRLTGRRVRQSRAQPIWSPLETGCGWSEARRVGRTRGFGSRGLGSGGPGREVSGAKTSVADHDEWLVDRIKVVGEQVVTSRSWMSTTHRRWPARSSR